MYVMLGKSTLKKTLNQTSWLLKQIFCSSYYGIVCFLLLIFEGKLIRGKFSKTTLVLGQRMWSPGAAESPCL